VRSRARRLCFGRGATLYRAQRSLLVARRLMKPPLYSLVLYRHYSNTHTLSGSTYFGAFMTAAPILGDTDWTDEWDYYSCFNGINVQSNYYNDDCAD
jgi:hypothetical protein